MLSRHAHRERKGNPHGLYLYDLEKKEFIAEYRVERYEDTFLTGGVFTNDGEKIVFSILEVKEEKNPDGRFVSSERLAVMKMAGSGRRFLTEKEVWFELSLCDG